MNTSTDPTTAGLQAAGTRDEVIPFKAIRWPGGRIQRRTISVQFVCTDGVQAYIHEPPEGAYTVTRVGTCRNEATKAGSRRISRLVRVFEVVHSDQLVWFHESFVTFPAPPSVPARAAPALPEQSPVSPEDDPQLLPPPPVPSSVPVSVPSSVGSVVSAAAAVSARRAWLEAQAQITAARDAALTTIPASPATVRSAAPQAMVPMPRMMASPPMVQLPSLVHDDSSAAPSFIPCTAPLFTPPMARKRSVSPCVGGVELPSLAGHSPFLWDPQPDTKRARAFAPVLLATSSTPIVGAATSATLLDAATRLGSLIAQCPDGTTGSLPAMRLTLLLRDLFPSSFTDVLRRVSEARTAADAGSLLEGCACEHYGAGDVLACLVLGRSHGELVHAWRNTTAGGREAARPSIASMVARLASSVAARPAGRSGVPQRYVELLEAFCLRWEEQFSALSVDTIDQLDALLQ
eukprot:m51a1_g2522 hypothetical protein (462) ;mRNA; r:222471-224221